MSKTWEIVNFLKEKGPLNQAALWSHFQPLRVFKSKTSFKDTVNNLRKSERVKAMLIQDNINNTKTFTYMLTSKRANFMTKEASLANLKRKEAYGEGLKAFFAEVKAGEETVMSQYRATRPHLIAEYKNTLKMRTAAQKRKRKRIAKLSKEAAEKQRDKQLKDKEQKAITKAEQKSSSPTLTKLDYKAGMQQKKISREMRRIAGVRKRISMTQHSLLKKGKKRADARNKLAAQRKAAGTPGTPARDALETMLRDALVQRVQAARTAKQKAKTRAEDKARAKAVARKAKQDKEVMRRVAGEAVTAAPPSFMRAPAPKQQKPAQATTTTTTKTTTKKVNQKEAAKQKKLEKQAAKKAAKAKQ